MPKKSEYVKFENLERKIKSPFKISSDFESILVPKDNGQQDRNESYSNKYEKHVACSYGYKLLCVDENLVSPSNHTMMNMMQNVNIRISRSKR